MHSMHHILVSVGCVCICCMYNVSVSGTTSQYMLLHMHINAARNVLVLVTGITSLVPAPFMESVLELFSQQMEVSRLKNLLSITLS